MEMDESHIGESWGWVGDRRGLRSIAMDKTGNNNRFLFNFSLLLLLCLFSSYVHSILISSPPLTKRLNCPIGNEYYSNWPSESIWIRPPETTNAQRRSVPEAEASVTFPFFLTTSAISIITVAAIDITGNTGIAANIRDFNHNTATITPDFLSNIF